MPPVAKAGGDSFRKDVQFTTKDDAEQRAVGIVMVPDKADLQHDFAREETIRSFASQFENFVDAGEGDGGIMHAAWPSDWMTLERNEVLNESQEIGGTTAPEGAWVQEWEFNNADLWSLVEDGILEGYSIGAVNVQWNGPFDPEVDDAVDDVEVPSQIPEDVLIWELDDGLVREVSAVDIPAVPDAEILDTKADSLKRLGDHLGDRDGFIDEAMERGHSESEAERMWDVLTDAIEVEGAGDPGKESYFERVGKAILQPLGIGGSAEATEVQSNHDAGGETPEKSTSTDTDMSDNADEDGGDGDKSLAEKNAEQINELTDAVKGLTEAVDGDGGDGDGGDGSTKTTEIEVDGDVYEVSKEEALGWFDEDSESKSSGDAPATKQDVEELHDRLDSITQQSGGTHQLDGHTGGDEKESGLDGLGKALS
jgi:hypothetical protein